MDKQLTTVEAWIIKNREQHTPKEMATALGVTVGRISQLLRQAKEKLGEPVKKYVTVATPYRRSEEPKIERPPAVYSNTNWSELYK